MGLDRRIRSGPGPGTGRLRRYVHPAQRSAQARRRSGRGRHRSQGNWYFEVKHWNADFVWQNGAWQILQFDQATQNFEPVPLNEYPDQQWARMRDEALASLNAAGNLLKKLPVLGNIQGGLVFSNVHARIEIDRTAAVPLRDDRAVGRGIPVRTPA